MKLVISLVQLFIVITLAQTCFAQTFQHLKVGNSSPIDTSALLEVQGTSGALLVPRMTTTQKNSIPSPANGDLVYDTSLNQFSGYQNGSWSSIGGSYSFADSLNNSSGTITLVNDSATPGNSKYYGTNGSGTLGYFALPTSAIWGSITGTLSSQTDLNTALGLKAPLASPTFTGTVTGTFSGNLTGNVTGNVSGTSGSTTGNAATVTTNANLTGPVTSVGNATSVTNNALTNAMVAQMATNTIKGNNTGGTANAADLTVSQVNTMLGTLTNPMTTANDIIYGGVSGLPTRLATASGVLVGGGTPAYSTTPTLTGTNFTNIPLAGLASAAYSTSSTVSTLAERDANANLTANAHFSGFTTAVTAAQTVTMTIASTQINAYTGSSTATVKLPTTSVVAGNNWLNLNYSTGLVALQASGGAVIQSMAANTGEWCYANASAPTTAAGWNCSYFALGVVPLTLGGTGLSAAGSDGQILKYQGGVALASSYRDSPEAINYIGDANLESTVGSWLTYNNRSTVTLTSASPSVGTVAATATYYTGMPFIFTGTTAATGTTLGTTYYMSVINGTTFNFSASLGGAFVNTSSTGTSLSIAPLVPTTGTGGVVTGLTLSRNTTTPIRGAGDLKLVQTNATVVAGEGLTYAFTIDAADEAHVLGVSFDFNVSSTFVASSGRTGPIGSSGVDSDLEVWIYDVTNAKLVPVSPRVITANGANNFTFRGSFQSASNSVSYRFLIHTATNNANATGWTFKGDNFYVGQQITSQGTAQTDWTAYTPSSTQGFGIISASTFFWKRVGDLMWITGNLTVGTPTATQMQIALPNGATIDATKMPVSTIVGYAARHDSGFGGIPNPIGLGGNNFLQFSFGLNSDALTPANGTSVVTVGSIFNFTAAVPITGWSSNSLMSSDANTNVVSASMGVASFGTISYTAATTVVWPLVLKDTTGSYNSGTGVYTVPVSGRYQVSTVGLNPNTGSSIHLQLFKNGSFYNEITFLVSTSTVSSGILTIDCIAGDQLTTQFTSGTAVAGNPTFYSPQLDITKITGPATIAQTETVAASYTAAANVSVTAGSPIILPTLNYDTHSAYSTGTGLYTVPVAGIYEVSVAGILAQTTAFGINVYKNGVSFNFILNAQTSTTGVSGVLKVKCLAGDTLSIVPDTSSTLRFIVGSITPQLDITLVH